MHMSFWWSVEVKNFVFPGFNITTVGGLIATCFGLAVLSILLEWLKLFQIKLRQKELLLRAKQIRTICQPSESALLIGRNRQNVEPLKITLLYRIGLIVWDAFLWLNVQILGYLLMLVAMAYNGWMVISLILGTTIGYFIFGPHLLKINLDNCEIIREAFCVYPCNEQEQDNEATPVLGPSTSTAPQPDYLTTACVHESP